MRIKFKLLLLLTVIGLNSCTIKRNVPIENIDFIPTISDFADYYEMEISPQDDWENNKLFRFLDGSYILEYEFDDDEASLAELQLYYNFELEYLAEGQNAEASMQDNIRIYGSAYDEEYFGERLRHDLALACDAYYLAEYYLLDSEDESAVMTMLIARKNNMVVTFIISTNDSEYEDLIDGFFNTYLQRIENDKPSAAGTRQI